MPTKAELYAQMAEKVTTQLTALGNLLVFFKGLRLCSLGNIRGGGFGQHSQHKFQIRKILQSLPVDAGYRQKYCG